MTLIYLSGAWVTGILVESLLLPSGFSLPDALLLSGLIPLPLLLLGRQHRKIIVLSSLSLVALLGGAWRFQTSSPPLDQNYLRFYNEQGIVTVSGLIERDPELRDKTGQLRLSAENITVGREAHRVSGSVLLIVPRYPGYHYGDLLSATGRLETPPQLDDFDYRGYLAHQGTYSIMSYPEIKILETGRGFKPLSGIYRLRNNLAQTLAEALPEPQASLAQGIILGIRGNIPTPIREDFTRTGTAHLLAISGQNLSIVAGILLSLGLWLFGKRGYLYIWLALGTIWLYTLLTGMQPPVFRSAIMASVFLIAELTGRQHNAIVALIFAAAIMAGISPPVLWDASFQMSFAAMAGLIFIFPPIQALGKKAVSTTLGEEGVFVSLTNFTVDSLSVSLGAIIAVWPLIAYYFGIISPIAPLSTLLALPALPGIIIAGSLTGGLGLLFLPAAQVTAWLTWLFASYLLLVVQAFAAIPVIAGTTINPTTIGVYYSLLALALWLNHQRQKVMKLMAQTNDYFARLPKKWLIPGLAVVALLVSIAAASMPDDNLHVSFIDVGQGDATLIQRGSQQILVDGGPSPQAIVSALGREMPFWDRTIDLVVLTHPHADHLDGLVEVLNRYQVEQVLYPDLASDSPQYDEWFNLIDKKNIKATTARAGQQIKAGEVIIEVLNPPSPPLSDTESDIDNNGVVLRLKIGEVSFLITGDMQWQAEWELIARRANLASTVLKVGHHGSRTSTTAEFLAVVNPRLAVISVGENNTFGHPNQEVMDRLKQKLGQGNIYRTDERGRIEFTTDGERLWVRAER